MTGHKTWLHLEEVTSDDLNGFLGDQVVHVFPSTAARNAAIPAPYTGMVTLQTDTGTLTQYASGAWVTAPWNAGRGLVAPVVNPANFNFTSTLAGSATAAINLAAKRTFRLTAAGQVLNQTVTGVIDSIFAGKSSATPITNTWTMTQTTASGSNAFFCQGIYQTTVAESFGAKIYAVSSASAAIQICQNLALWFEDIGPNGAP